MKKLFIISITLIILLSLSACSIATGKSDNSAEKIEKKAEKIEIINFHSTYQCYSCVYIGDTMFKIIEDQFKEDYQSGKIIFKKINVDKPENKDIVDKYQARGSSLFFNIIIDGKDNISEDTNVWRLVGNDQAFQNYIVKKINDNLK
ncbi:MAG TPA: nitrophenyl compound nitroreductase subunit ArsF family protein [bacterium]|nr:nitrophenyl compound nitroreductase subunit ArsF family protein [bacterium]